MHSGDITFDKREAALARMWAGAAARRALHAEIARHVHESRLARQATHRTQCDMRFDAPVGALQRLREAMIGRSIGHPNSKLPPPSMLVEIKAMQAVFRFDARSAAPGGITSAANARAVMLRRGCL